MKRRFPCLNYLRLSPNYAGKVVTACMTLHNVSNKEDFDWEMQEESVPTLTGQPDLPQNGVDPRGVAKVRELLAYFG